jgi:DNA-directed RNA polymerase specialized sigma24 family protein
MLQSVFKSAMLDQLDSVYALAYALTRCRNRADELCFVSFGSALKKVKADHCIGCSPRLLLFRSMYQILCGATPESAMTCSSVIDSIDMPETINASDYGELDWHSPSDELNAALDSIPIGLRFVLYLWAAEAIPSLEIAEILEVSAEVICVRLAMARARLYRSLTLNRQRTVCRDICTPFEMV